MKFRSIILLAFFVSGTITSYAQHKPCGSADVNNEEIAKDPAKAELQQKLHREALEYTETYDENNRGGLRVIPVVIHVMHDGGDENIPKEQVLNAIEIINEDFQLLNADQDMIVEEFDFMKANTGVEFRLAKLDPDGNCTEGITRTKTPLTFDAGENVKDLISWNTSMYLNVWVVEDIASGAGGYAYYPGNAPGQDHEGIVINNGQFGGIGESGGSNFARRSLTHEIGHWLNLAHTWGSTNENNVETNCFSDDGVNDTPNTIGSAQNCTLGQNTCGSLDNVQNYMDYSTCGRMFSSGQAARMNSAMESYDAGPLGYYRRNLWQQSNLEATGTNDGFENVCAPIADFTADKEMICLGEEVQFMDESYNAEVDGTWTWNWSFEGGDPATSTDQNPTVVFNTAGEHNVSLTVTNSTGSGSQTYSNLISVSGSDSNTNAPFMEGMEYSNWPLHSSDPNLNWVVENETSSTWYRSAAAAHTGEASARINMRTVSRGATNSLISQPFNLTDVLADGELSFWYAHSPRSGEDSDERMRVYLSKNCGASWNIKFTRQGTSLHTTETTHSNFVPDANEWEYVDLSLSGYYGEPHVLIKFETVSDRTSNLFLDDINISSASTGIQDGDISSKVDMFPNPTNGVFNVSTRLENTSVVIVDMNGKQVFNEQLQSAGRSSYDLSHLTAGIYLVRFGHELGISTQKLVLNH